MWRYPVLFSLALAVASAGPASAQPPKDDIRKLEAELENLKEKIRDLDSRLQKVRALSAKKGDDGRPFPPFGEKGKGFKGFGGFDPEKMKQMKEQFEGRGKESAKKKGDAEKDKGKGPPSMRGGFGGGGFGGGFGRPERPREDGRAAEIDRRLERIAGEIDELRRELKRK